MGFHCFAADVKKPGHLFIGIPLRQKLHHTFLAFRQGGTSRQLLASPDTTAFNPLFNNGMVDILAQIDIILSQSFDGLF